MDFGQKCWFKAKIFYQLFGLSFWWHPFSTVDPLVSKECDAKFLQMCSNEVLNSLYTTLQSCPESTTFSSLRCSCWNRVRCMCSSSISFLSSLFIFICSLKWARDCRVKGNKPWRSSCTHWVCLFLINLIISLLNSIDSVYPIQFALCGAYGLLNVAGMRLVTTGRLSSSQFHQFFLHDHDL